MATASLRISIADQRSTSHKKSLFVGHPRSILFNPLWTRLPPSRTAVLCFSSRRRNSVNSPASSKKVNKKIVTHTNVEEKDDIDEDAFEALFSQLEEDLKNDDLFGNDGEDDDISEEELAKLERELAEALADDEFIGAYDSAAVGENKNENDLEEDDNVDDDEGGAEVDEEEEEEEEEESPMKLKNWQFRRLAYALKNGRRKTSIKNLAAELCLDRAVVLKLLRDPPPNLVMLSAALPDKPVSTILESEEKVMETVPLETRKHAAKPEVKVKMPVHEMQRNWSARKRLKKVQVETLEKVYRRTKRPTNAMISSIVHVTNLPRKKVVQWFEDKRAEDGVPDNRLPYQRPATQTVFTS